MDKNTKNFTAADIALFEALEKMRKDTEDHSMAARYRNPALGHPQYTCQLTPPKSPRRL